MIMSAGRRIVSFLPSATEMAFALGLGDELLGVTHECDYPPQAQNKPVVVRSILPVETMSQAQIDFEVTKRLRNGQSLYEVDERLMRSIAPDLILTQELCQVCAPSGNEVSQMIQALPLKPEILWLTPRSLDQIFDNLLEVGRATGRLALAEQLVTTSHARLQKLRNLTGGLSHRPRVFCMEWLDPVYCSGHWVPEMVKLAGGIDQLGREGTDSVRIPWEAVVAWAPEILIVMPCGYHLDAAANQARRLIDYPGYSDLPAVRDDRVYVVDASSYFARPGPRVLAGAELLAHLIHPERIGWDGAHDAFRKLVQ
ncbi:MAG: cobalamin-binding protein [Rhodospirillaceae bacterium]|nr:MAG: cobalamin-binding protein [Rhodospirillaceae bacterium]